jgi:hypothetical protein
MNAVTNIWRQLVRNKLWPVAVLLLAALVAVPMLLAREPALPDPIAPVAVNTAADDSIAEPIVAKVTPEDRSRRRRVLGVRKDPFKPAPVKKPKAVTADVPEAPQSDAPSIGDTGGGGGSGEPAEAPVFYEPGTIIVRFGEASGSDLTRFAIPKLGPVPDDEFPLLVYMGLTKDGKKAKFMVDAAIEADGDGDCKPHPSNCEVVELAVGETEFLDVINPEPEDSATEDDAEDDAEDETAEETEPEVVATFQLDLVDIKRAGDSDVR